MARPRSDIRPRILHAARARFLLEGVDGASLRAIAEDAKTSIGMVYYYFETKDELFLAVVEEVYVGLVEGFAQALQVDVAVPERIRRLYARVGSSSAEEFMVLRIILREVLINSTRLHKLVERFQARHLPLVLGTILEGLGTGEIDDTLPLPALMASLLGLAVGGLLVRRVVGHELVKEGMPDAEEMASALSRVLFKGVRPRAPSIEID